MEKIGSKSFGNRKGPEPVGHGGQRVLDQVLRPKENPLLVTGGTEEPGFAREGDDAFFGAVLAGIHRHALSGIAADQESVDRVIHTRAKKPERGLKARRIDALEGGIIVVQHAKERALMKHSSAVLDGDPGKDLGGHSWEDTNSRADSSEGPKTNDLRGLPYGSRRT
jgi:hypothetical protein